MSQTWTPWAMPQIQLAGILYGSHVNGPGERTVMWMQGCVGMNCPGCWNLGTHAPKGGYSRPVKEFAAELAEQTPSRSYTISGGEPFQQVDALASLIVELRRIHQADSIIVYTGYSLPELRNMPRKVSDTLFASDIIGYGFNDVSRPPLLSMPDVLVAGRYNYKLPFARELRSSSNQELVFLTRRHTFADFDRENGFEVHAEGETHTTTGFPPPEVIA